MDPNLRASAPECLRRTLQLRVPGRCLTRTPPTCGLRQEQTEDDDGSTAIILDKLWGTQGTSYPDKKAAVNVKITIVSPNNQVKAESLTQMPLWTTQSARESPIPEAVMSLPLDFFTRNDHFSRRLQSQFTADAEAEEPNAPVRHDSPVLPRSEEAITGHPALASFEQRVLQLLA
ncbi:hypothetical protein M011DRAFT_472829, partial [Sporormia fimetaria CBS 119925]